MYKISVPVMNSNVKKSDKKRLVQELRRLDAERVFLALDTYKTDTAERKAMIEELTDNCRFFKEEGFEVGAWIWTFWINDNTEYVNMRTISGDELKLFMCPSDPNFVDFASGYIKDIASCGLDIMMFDDDFRYGFFADSPACLCDNHIAAINKLTDSNLTREQLEGYISNGEPNKYRDAYIKANGDSFISFAKAMRSAVDEINPSIRLGACACMTSWDIDGIDAYELATILAGNTQPFVRLIGAPYWAVNKNWGNMLQDVIELERMESTWTKNGNIEIMAEGDAYPRPRTTCPASFVEGFDMAIRVAGCTNGILKYGIDYNSNADYETGYAKFHERNRDTYAKIDKMFGNKKSCGVRVYETMKKLSAMKLPTKVNSTPYTQDLFFSKAARSMAFNTIPTVYEGDGVCGIVFDENARHLTDSDLKNGLILDIAAAEILSERGIDTGLEYIGQQLQPSSEHFVSDNNRIGLYDAAVYDIRLKNRAEILSYTPTDNGTIPVSYRYENADGNRFVVLNFNTRSKNDYPLKHYARSRQYAEAAEWLSGNKLPAYLYGNPAMYIQCKKDDNALAVGIWNFCADTAIEPVARLDRKYSHIEFVNCSGRLDGDKVYLDDIIPYAFAAFEVK